MHPRPQKASATALLSLLVVSSAFCGDLPLVTRIDWQPFAAQVKRLVEASDYLGSPLNPEEKGSIQTLLQTGEGKDAPKLQEILDRHCLFGVQINPEMRVKVAQGPASAELVEDGWRVFLVKVQNDSGTTAELRAISPNAMSLFESYSANNASDQAFKDKPKPRPPDGWLDLQMFNGQPLKKPLSGLPLEYRIVQLYSRDAGKREAKISFSVGQGTQDLGYRNEADVLFNCLPAHEVVLRVLDEHNEPTTASFLIRDAQQRVYPALSKRLAPDFAFHQQVYRSDGEMLKLPAGQYNVSFSRGPETIPQESRISVSSTPARQTNEFKVVRWIDPSVFGWWSGDHHIHAAGCAHYVKPTEGVRAEDMIRQCMGEDLKVGANLTWGPCFDYQKQFFCGTIDKVSKYPYLLRYDIEVSGFGSHQSGHLCLLRLKEEIYPGGDSSDHWPKLCLNTLRWAKKQGAVCGPAHSGWGLEVKTDELPNYIIPPYSGIGANEYIVDVTHDVPGPDGKLIPAVDFLSMGDTPYVWELNMWYQTLNVGFRTRISGETDFPCIYGEKVGLGRSYVKLDGKLDYDQWCEGIHRGGNYVSDGKSHLMEFAIDDVRMGENGSELKLAKAGTVHATARVAAMLPETANTELKNLPYDQKPYWDIERARVSASQQVPVELIVNGYPVAKKMIEANGKIQEVTFDVPIQRSSWVAMRILPSSHTNPIFVLVDGKPIRASRRSAEWCLKGVDQCASQKIRFVKGNEKQDFRTAYDHARIIYKKLLAECQVD